MRFHRLFVPALVATSIVSGAAHADSSVSVFSTSSSVNGVTTSHTRVTVNGVTRELPNVSGATITVRDGRVVSFSTNSQGKISAETRARINEARNRACEAARSARASVREAVQAARSK